MDGLGAGATWGCCPEPRRFGRAAFDPRGDVCHVHADRVEAERCGVLLSDAPELVRLDQVRPAVYPVAWSLSSAASGRLRRRTSWKVHTPGGGQGPWDRAPWHRLLLVALTGWRA